MSRARASYASVSSVLPGSAQLSRSLRGIRATLPTWTGSARQVVCLLGPGIRQTPWGLSGNPGKQKLPPWFGRRAVFQ